MGDVAQLVGLVAKWQYGHGYSTVCNRPIGSPGDPMLGCDTFASSTQPQCRQVGPVPAGCPLDPVLPTRCI